MATISKDDAAREIASAGESWAAADAQEKSGEISAAEAKVLKDEAHATAENARAKGGFESGGDDGTAGDSYEYIKSTREVTVSNEDSGGDDTRRITINGGSQVKSAGWEPVTGGQSWVGANGKVYVDGVDTGYRIVVPTVSNDDSDDDYDRPRNKPVIIKDDTVTAPAHSKVPVNKKEYVYGIRELKIYGLQCEKNSVYVSTEYRVPGNIAEVELDAREMHPLYDYKDAGTDNSRCTSIEYYISYLDNHWLPILPKYEDRIINELLFISKNEAVFRFPALVSEDIEVFENGILYKGWHMAPAGKGIVFTSTPNAKADYTVNYVPDTTKVNPYLVRVSDQNIQPTKFTNEYNEEGEVFTGTKSNCTIELSHTPYIDYEQINAEAGYDPNTSSYKPIQVYLEDGKIVIPNSKTTDAVDPYVEEDVICTKNKTDYINQTIPQLSPYSLVKDPNNGNKPTNMVFEYSQNKNTLTFTETFRPSDNIDNLDISKATANIRVKYSYLIAGIRVKIILRRTGLVEETSLRPYVEEYTLSIKTLE